MRLEPIPGRQFETEISLFSQGSLIKGELSVDQTARLHGRVEGKIIGLEPSLMVISETGSVHGEIQGDEVIIDGFVSGNISAKRRIVLSESARVIGDLHAPNIEIKFGCFFEGKAVTTKSHPRN